MPELVPITNNFFVNLITRLGLKPPPGFGWLFSTVVQPVSIVDSDISFAAVATSPLLDTPLSAGAQAAPAVNTVLADTGAQAAGVYNIVLALCVADVASATQPTIALQRRDAANAANIWEQRIYGNSSANGVNNVYYFETYRVQLQANERIRFINLVAGGAGSLYDANIWISPTT